MGKWERKCWQTKMYVEENNRIPIERTRRKPLKMVMAPMHESHVHFLTANQHAGLQKRSSSVSTPSLMKNSTLQSYLSIASHLSHQSGKSDFRVLTPMSCWSFFCQLGSFPQVGRINNGCFKQHGTVDGSEILRSPVEGTVVYSLSHQFTGFFTSQYVTIWDY